MSYLDSHLEQISLSCQGIDSLPFPPPKIFTNALLANHDITALIRDTESHERALFSVPPPPPPPPHVHSTKKRDVTASLLFSDDDKNDDDDREPATKRRRQTVFNVTASGGVTTGPVSATTSSSTTRPPRRSHTAVAAVLGGAMHERLRKGTTSTTGDGAAATTVDVEVLLQGAEKLCGVYDMPGARERIGALRARHRGGKDTMAYYEAKLAAQAEQLASMNRDWTGSDSGDDDDDDGGGGLGRGDIVTEEDLKREEAEAREMEAKKRELQARLRQMEKDLGGLMNM